MPLSSDDEGDDAREPRARAGGGASKDVIRADIAHANTPVRSVFDCWPAPFVKEMLGYLSEAAAHCGAFVPPEAEDIALSFGSPDAVATHVHRCAPAQLLPRTRAPPCTPTLPPSAPQTPQNPPDATPIAAEPPPHLSLPRSRPSLTGGVAANLLAA